MTNNIKKGLATFLVLMTIINIFVVGVSAATTDFTFVKSSKPLKTYTLTTKDSTPYTSSSLKDRGTEGRESSTAYVAGTDELWIYKIGKNSAGTLYIYFSYPVGSTRYKAYMPLSKVTKANGGFVKTYATGLAYTYRRSDGSGSNRATMYIESGDEIYLFATTDKYYQIMYPVGNGTAYRLAWITKADYNKFCKGSKPTHDNVNSSNSFDPVWPCKKAYYITTLYAYRYWYDNDVTRHGCYSNNTNNDGFLNGIDIAGGGDIVATESGKVTYVGNAGDGFGKKVVISHGNGYFSLYGHLSSYSVSKGDKVAKGQVIGRMGSTGNSNGEHVHFELWKEDQNGNAQIVDPFLSFFESKYRSKISIGSNSKAAMKRIKALGNKFYTSSGSYVTVSSVAMKHINDYLSRLNKYYTSSGDWLTKK